MSCLDRLRDGLADSDPGADVHNVLGQLIRAGLDQIPLPGSGRTMQRWQALAMVAEHDLSLAKLYEGHTDALAILAELGHSPALPADAIWGVWAAESPDGRAAIHSAERHGAEASETEGDVTLGGGKNWCSGAAGASDALLTAWEAGGVEPQLVRLRLQQPGVVVDSGAWHAVGMAGSASLEVRFHGARAHRVGRPGDYLARPGFWQGGAGIAACWYGGTLAIAKTLRRAVAEAPVAARTPFRMAALGKVDLALCGTAGLLREAARWIDAHPTCDASEVALRVRLAADASARLCLDEVGRSMGATPYCRDARFARMAADLPVFIRQCHAERDCAALGERVLERQVAASGGAMTSPSSEPGAGTWEL